MDEVAGESRLSQVVQSLTFVKLVVEATRVKRSMDLNPVEFRVKRVSNVAFGIDKNSEGLVGSVRPVKSRKLDLRIKWEALTSAGGMTGDFGLSEVDAMLGTHASVRPTGSSRFPAESSKVKRPTREELTAQENFSQHLRFYPSQSAKTLLKDFFEVKPSTISNLEHTTISLCADSIIDTVFEVRWLVSPFNMIWSIRGLVVACTKAWRFQSSWAAWPITFL